MCQLFYPYQFLLYHFNKDSLSFRQKRGEHHLYSLSRKVRCRTSSTRLRGQASVCLLSSNPIKLISSVSYSSEVNITSTPPQGKSGTALLSLLISFTTTFHGFHIRQFHSTKFIFISTGYSTGNMVSSSK